MGKTAFRQRKERQHRFARRGRRKNRVKYEKVDAQNELAAEVNREGPQAERSQPGSRIYEEVKQGCVR